MLCSGKETSNVLVVLENDDEWDDDVAGDNDGCPGGSVRQR
jgi:hypothetical protein